MPGTVTIGCKLPSGLHLNLFRMDDAADQVMGGGTRIVKRAVRTDHVTIQGTRRRVDDPRVLYGYALTPNVDADFWAEWLKANADADVVKNGLIFAHAKHEETKAMARCSESVRSGFEPIVPGDLPPEFKKKIETATAPATRN